MCQSEPLKRYDLDRCDGCDSDSFAGMVETPKGDFVEFIEAWRRLQDLTRYDDCGSGPEESPSGVWVYFDDVIGLFEE